MHSHVSICFLLNRYKVFQFIGVDYGGREAALHRSETRLVVNKDELLLIKCKYNRGCRRAQHDQWLFRMYGHICPSIL